MRVSYILEATTGASSSSSDGNTDAVIGGVAPPIKTPASLCPWKVDSAPLVLYSPSGRGSTC